MRLSTEMNRHPSSICYTEANTLASKVGVDPVSSLEMASWHGLMWLFRVCQDFIGVGTFDRASRFVAEIMHCFFIMFTQRT